jgi:glycosyltransferase involved in cell wall biosynthesis
MRLLVELENLDLAVIPIIHTDNGWRAFKPNQIKSGRIAGTHLNDPIVPRSGDQLLMAEIDYGLPPAAFAEILAMKARGLKVSVMVYDMFYLTRPHWFTVAQVLNFHRWLTRLHRVANTVMCNSFHCADQLALWRQLAKSSLPIETDIPIAVFPLGADSFSRPTHQQLKPAADALSFQLPDDNLPTFLTIAALHPRKGVDLLLNAFQTLWGEGKAVRLVVAGINRDQRLADLITHHPEIGSRLFYQGFLGDQQIIDIANRCDALIVPSREEGFGLPLVEACHLGLPVIARDIAVFREIASNQPFYFNEELGEDLASRLTIWLALSDAEKKAYGTLSIAISWSQAATQLATLLFSSLSYRKH